MRWSALTGDEGSAWHPRYGTGLVGFLVTTATGPLPEQALLGRGGFWNKTWLPLPGSCHGNSGSRASAELSLYTNHDVK